MEAKRTIYDDLVEIQRDLKVGKERYSEFGEYAFRNKEDVLTAVKPLAHERNCAVLVDEDLVELKCERVYVKATAILAKSGEDVSVKAFAREQKEKKKFDESQITGSTSSYAGKRALSNLFAIDDTPDMDGTESRQDEQLPRGDFVAKCAICGKAYRFAAGTTLDDLDAYQCAACGHSDFKVAK